MWQLKPNDKKAEEYFQRLVLPKIRKMFNNDGTINETYHKQRSTKTIFKGTNLVNVISLKSVEELIISRPKKISHLNKEILRKIFNITTNIHDYINKIKAIEKKEQNINKGNLTVSLTSDEKSLIDNYRKEIDAINILFDYDTVINNNSGIGYDLAKTLNINTCTYCNRMYTLTVTKNNKTVGIRPQFDHWFPRSIYPLLALSYYNLIPSCNLCNSSLKGQTDFALKKYLHPYIIKNTGFNFRFEVNDFDKWDFKLSVVINDDCKKAFQHKVEQTLNIFALREISSAHSPFELKDIMDKFPNYDTTYIENIFQMMKDINPKIEDVYRCIFGTAILPCDYLNRPFSKMTYDILDQLELLDNLNVFVHRKKRKKKLVLP
ncbi:MAG: hypothetical protein QM653_14950 [Dysgonomonas sp.]|uniref:hypothetical protein n=1 Tax=Dysgonomonas sp. TaxID=1891233 RepID=UPI0039E60E45